MTVILLILLICIFVILLYVQYTSKEKFNSDTPQNILENNWEIVGDHEKFFNNKYKINKEIDLLFEYVEKIGDIINEKYFEKVQKLSFKKEILNTLFKLIEYSINDIKYNELTLFLKEYIQNTTFKASHEDIIKFSIRSDKLRLKATIAKLLLEEYLEKTFKNKLYLPCSYYNKFNCPKTDSFCIFDAQTDSCVPKSNTANDYFNITKESPSCSVFSKYGKDYCNNVPGCNYNDDTCVSSTISNENKDLIKEKEMSTCLKQNDINTCIKDKNKCSDFDSNLINDSPTIFNKKEELCNTFSNNNKFTCSFVKHPIKKKNINPFENKYFGKCFDNTNTNTKYNNLVKLPEYIQYSTYKGFNENTPKYLEKLKNTCNNGNKWIDTDNGKVLRLCAPNCSDACITNEEDLNCRMDPQEKICKIKCGRIKNKTECIRNNNNCFWEDTLLNGYCHNMTNNKSYNIISKYLSEHKKLK